MVQGQRVSANGVLRPKWDTSIAVLPKAQRLLWKEWQKDSKSLRLGGSEQTASPGNDRAITIMNSKQLCFPE